MDDNIYWQPPENQQNSQQLQQQSQYPPPFPEKPRHSGLGIASFIIAFVSAILLFALFVKGAIIEIQTPGGMQEDDPIILILGLGFLACILFYFVGIILAIVGLCQANRSKVFSVLGLIFNVIFLLPIVGMMILGILLAE